MDIVRLSDIEKLIGVRIREHQHCQTFVSSRSKIKERIRENEASEILCLLRKAAIDLVGANPQIGRE